MMGVRDTSKHHPFKTMPRPSGSSKPPLATTEGSFVAARSMPVSNLIRSRNVSKTRTTEDEMYTTSRWGVFALHACYETAPTRQRRYLPLGSTTYMIS